MLKIKEGFVMRNIIDEWIIVPVGARAESNTYIMSVNDTGHLLWELLEKGTTEEEMLQAMLAEYEVDEATAKGDIEAFVQALREKAMLKLTDSK